MLVGAALLVALVPLHTDIVDRGKVTLQTATLRRLVVASLLEARVVDHIDAVDVRLVPPQMIRYFRFVGAVHQAILVPLYTNIVDRGKVQPQTASYLRLVVASLLVAREEDHIATPWTFALCVLTLSAFFAKKEQPFSSHSCHVTPILWIQVRCLFKLLVVFATYLQQSMSQACAAVLASVFAFLAFRGRSSFAALISCSPSWSSSSQEIHALSPSS